ncbi:hypothetical protein IWQ51_000906 [Labrenzia sp. EL_142]|nr:hypothetical protein [Labrenzia sp. EL_142]
MHVAIIPVTGITVFCHNLSLSMDRQRRLLFESFSLETELRLLNTSWGIRETTY